MNSCLETGGKKKLVNLIGKQKLSTLKSEEKKILKKKKEYILSDPWDLINWSKESVIGVTEVESLNRAEKDI